MGGCWSASRATVPPTTTKNQTKSGQLKAPEYDFEFHEFCGKPNTAKAKAVKDLIYHLEYPNLNHDIKFQEFSRKEIDTKSMLSAKSGDSMVFPNLADIEVLTHTPAKTCFKMENTFWAEKRKLIPDYSVMEKIDEHALKAKDSLRNDAVKLVEYLTQPCTSEVQKARAIIRWMGENVEYDTNLLETGTRGDQSVGAVLRTGRAMCEGYGNVLNHLTRLAGLEARIIKGQGKGAGFSPGAFNPKRLSKGPCKHAWGAVRINDKWYLCDPTYAAGAVIWSSGKPTYDKEWNEVWFISDPTYYVLSHIPLAKDTIVADDQFLDKPITDPSMWTNLALLHPQSGVYGIRPVTHKNCVIKTSSGDISIQYASRYPLDQFVTVKRIEKTGMQYAGPEIDNMVALFTLQGKCVIMCRFQEPGTYEIVVWGGIKNHLPNDRVLAYRINAAQKSQLGSFPVGLDSKWGVKKDFMDAGYNVKYPKDCIIKTSNGIAVIKVQLPTDGLLPNMHKLAYSNGKGATANFEGYVIPERRGDTVLYRVQCPQAGEYKLQVYMKYENSVENQVGAAFLIKCDSPAKNPYKVDTKKILGIDENFLECGLATSAVCTILKVKNGKARLRIKKTKPAKLLAKLKSGENVISGAIDKKEDGDMVTFTIKPPMPGFYIVNVFASPANQASQSFAARFGVNFDAII